MKLAWKDVNDSCDAWNAVSSLSKFLHWDGVLIIRHPRSPSIRCGNMLSKRSGLAGFLIEILSVRATRHRIVFPEQAAGLQLWKQEVYDILEGLWE